MPKLRKYILITAHELVLIGQYKVAKIQDIKTPKSQCTPKQSIQSIDSFDHIPNDPSLTHVYLGWMSYVLCVWVRLTQQSE